MHPFSSIEPLEDRIAPATLIDPNTVTYRDTEGDFIVVQISKPLFVSEEAASAILLFNTRGVDGDNSSAQTLSTINLVGESAARGMNISVTVQQKLGAVGNGKADVGYIAAAQIDPQTFQFSDNIDLGTVRVQGNLGRIDVGDSSPSPALRLLDVDSMNQLLVSNILGPVTEFHVRGDFDGAQLKVYGSEFGNIGKLTIDGTLRGRTADNSGQIFVSGKISAATIGNIAGGSGASSGTLLGTLFRASSISNVHVIGSITGGTADIAMGQTAAQSGSIIAKTVGLVHVDGSLIGGSGTESGLIFGQNSLGTVNIGGTLTGGSAQSAGIITSNARISAVFVGGSVLGGAGDSSGKISAPTSIGTVGIGGHLQGAAGTESGEIFATTLGSVKIVGDLIGGSAGTSSAAGNSGTIQAANAGSIEIGGSMIGGDSVDATHTANVSGAIVVSNGTLGTLSIGGDVKGGTGTSSGAVLGLDIGSIAIGGNLLGGAGSKSGIISASQAFFTLSFGSIGSLRIGGNVQGGAGTESGKIVAGTTLDNAAIDGSLIGGSVNQSTVLDQSGYIVAGHIGSLTIGQDVIAGTNSGSGAVSNSGAIRSTGDIDTILINGNLTGNAKASAIISAVGQSTLSATTPTDIAINSITVMQNVSRAQILAGYNANTSSGAQPRGQAVNADAQINTIRIGQNLSATNIVAGAQPTTTANETNGTFGDTDDRQATRSSSPGVTNRLSAISGIFNVIIGGTATGSADTANEHFGIVAENIVAVTIGGTPQVLQPGAFNDRPGVAISPNFTIIELPNPNP